MPIELKSKKTCVWKSITEEMELSPFPEAELLGLCCIVEELDVDLLWLWHFLLECLDRYADFFREAPGFRKTLSRVFNIIIT